MRKLAAVLFCFGLCGGLTGCGWFSRNFFSIEGEPVVPPEVGKTENVPSVSESALEGGSVVLPSVAGVEIVWQVPTEPVDSYLIDYGEDPNNLTHHLEIGVEHLTRFDHPSQGPVFRYRVAGVDKNKDLYVVMRAKNKFGISDPSAPIRVPAEGGQ